MEQGVLYGIVLYVREHTLEAPYRKPKGPIKVAASEQIVFASNDKKQAEAERDRRQTEASRNVGGLMIHEASWMRNRYSSYRVEPVEVMPAVLSPS